MAIWRKFALKTKMFLTFTFILLVIIFFICVTFYFFNVNDLKRQTYSLSSMLSSQFNQTVNLYIKDMEQLSTSIFTDPYVQSSFSNYENQKNPIEEMEIVYNLFPRLFNSTYPRPEVEQVSLHTMSGTTFNYKTSGKINISYKEEPEDWEESLDLIPKSDYLLLPTTVVMFNNEPKGVFSLVRNIYEIPNRNKIGAMEIAINVETIEELLVTDSRTDLEDYIRIFILSDHGEVVFDNKGSLTGEKAVSFGESILSKDSANGELTWDEVEYYYSLEKSSFTGWNTVILIPEEFNMAEKRKIQVFIIFIGILSTALIAIVSLYLSHHSLRPLTTMMVKMRRVQQGKLHERIELTGNKEIDTLSRVYNSMLDSIARLINEVYESKITEKNAKISALQSQINPHFLYNTLNIMRSISRIKGVNEVAELSLALSNLFKYTMKNLENPVPLRDEIEHVNNFMKIQGYRFGDRFGLNIDIPSELMDTKVLKLMIQPLIENAVGHGIANRSSGGIISLRVRKESDLLIIEVSDNGVGIEPELLDSIKSKLKSPTIYEEYGNGEMGIGLINTHQRIQLSYGYEYGLGIESKPSIGTTVTLIIPYNIHLQGGDEEK